ncbi:Pi starvation-induced protein [Musa troglodytarum]|uniref:Pi starvation-induced protein n=1 Tax=Musa troglodytarum TaxID=320322 RepID=A0A9E7KGT9_9LILI|nr:Pi starvation-induced protein [Musa troglodytarum]URE21701.1 Pi starvation-induced protein [Musa troglodytarum]
MKESTGSSISVLAVASLLFVLFSTVSILSPMAEAATKPQEAPQEEAATVNIVYVEKPEGEEPEAFHIRTLAAVLGSEEAAKDSLIYHYKHAASGFSAKLTRSQVEELSKQPGVLQVVPSRTVSLHGSRVSAVTNLGIV